MIKRKRINYLNNADLLIEIHKSKMTYCWVLDDKYRDFDIIVNDINDITLDLQKVAHDKRVKRLNTEKIRAVQKETNCTPKQALEVINDLYTLDVVDINDVVFRVMTNEHIPEADSGKKTKVNFKPFKHYIMADNGSLIEVARSHWKGSLEYGEFNTTKGHITNELGRMFLVLTAKIATRSNYRGYTFIDEMQSDACYWLTKNALSFNEARETTQLNPFAYYTTVVNNVFKAVLNVEKLNRNIRDDLLEVNGFDPSNSRIVDIELNMIDNKAKKVPKAPPSYSGDIFDFGD